MTRTHTFHSSRLGRVVLFVLFPMFGCAGNRNENQAALDAASQIDEVPAQNMDESQPVAAPAEDIIVRAGRPFKGYRVADQLELEEEELFTFLAAADAVCIGERHDAPLDHYAELRTLTAFADRRAIRGFELGLALEMVQTDAQSTLNKYLSGATDREVFLADSEWDQSWGFPIQFYDPQLLKAGELGVSGLALGVSPELSKYIAAEGLARLSESNQRKVPDLVLDNPEHRQLFDGLMQGHPLPPGGNLDHYYEAQVVWDERMAKSSKLWLMEHYPMRKLLIFAGVGHCHRSAIPSRMERGTELQVVNLITSEREPYAHGAQPEPSAEDLLYSGYEYQIIFE